MLWYSILPVEGETEPWVLKNSADKLFGKMPTSEWRSPSHVLEVTVGQELQSRLVLETRLDVFVEHVLRNTQDGKSIHPRWLLAGLLAMDDVPKAADSALSLLRHDGPFIRRPTWNVGWSLADDNQKQVENDSRSSLESNRNNASIELVDSLMLAKSATRIAILGISTSNLNDARRITVLVMQQRGDPLLIVGSTFGLMSPFHFFNSVSVGAVAICLPPCTARSSLLMANTHCVPDMEGAPVFDENSCVVGLLMNPLTEKGSNIEVRLVITGDAICTEWNSKHLPSAQQMSSVLEIPILHMGFLASISKEKSGTDLFDMVVQLFLFLDHSMKEIFATLASGPERSLCTIISYAYVGLYLVAHEQGALSHIANEGFAS
jgi:hypothetical protein